MTTLDSKDPVEKFAVEFDFSKTLASITDAVVTESVRGEYSPAGSIIDGSRAISGTKVFQRVGDGGTPGNDYVLRCEATDGVEKYVLVATIPVRAA